MDRAAATAEQATRFRIYRIDAFTRRPFAGNPAAVCPLDRWLPDDLMQAIAAENNLAQTAFYVPRPGDGGEPSFDLRWFTPTTEVDICGHATLASAHLILDRGGGGSAVVFHTRSGPLRVTRDGDRLSLDFPARPPATRAVASAAFDAAVADALGARPSDLLMSRDVFAVFDDASQVARLAPDMARIAAIEGFGVIATAPGEDCDFVSRFFAPKAGVPEDPVTGSAHCSLIPYWAARLGRPSLYARQISARGGELWCRHRGDRVTIAGHCTLNLEGVVTL